ncbi:putative universal stress protein [archaeon BMS3Bbin15]|nr:putative universal stress protein [archaeon BMS3Bbin15]
MKILVATDGSEEGDKAVEKAGELARLHNVGVSVITCEEKITGLPVEGAVEVINNAIEKDAVDILEKAKAKLAEIGVEATTEFRWGHPERQILDYAGKIDAELIVVGSRGKHMGEFKRFIMGSVSREIIENAKCSVLVVR